MSYPGWPSGAAANGPSAASAPASAPGPAIHPARLAMLASSRPFSAAASSSSSSSSFSSSAAATPVATSSSTATPALPPGWKVYHTPEGKPYYADANGKTYWSLPNSAGSSASTPSGSSSASTPAASASTPSSSASSITSITASKVWFEYKSPDGRPYYYNIETKQTTWTKPADFDTRGVSVAPASSPISNVVTAANASGTAAAAAAAAVAAEKEKERERQAQRERERAEKEAERRRREQERKEEEEKKAKAAAKKQKRKQEKEQKNKEREAIERAEYEKKAAETAAAVAAARAAAAAGLPPPVSLFTPSATAPAAVTHTPAAAAPTADSITALSEEPSKPGDLTFATEEEAFAAFKAMLKDKGVRPDAQWKEALTVIVFDPRYKALKTIEQRKVALAEYQEEIVREEEAIRAARQKKLKEDFFAMLKQCGELNGRSRYRDAVRLLSDDPRFLAVEREKERSDWVYDYVDELAAQEKKQKEEERRVKVQGFTDFLKEKTPSLITPEANWRVLREKFEEEKDPRFLGLEPPERVRLFDEYFAEILRADREKKALEREELKKKDKAAREEFRKLLAECVDTGRLHSKTRFKDFVSLVENDPRFKELNDLKGGTRPSAALEDFQDELAEKLSVDKKLIKEVVEAQPQPFISMADTVESVLQRLGALSSPRLAAVDPKHCSLIVAELVDKAQRKEKDRMKRKEGYLDSFLHSLEKRLSATSLLEAFGANLATLAASLEPQPGASAEDNVKHRAEAESQLRVLWAKILASKATDVTSASAYRKLSSDEQFRVFLQFVTTKGPLAAAALAPAASASANGETSVEAKAPAASAGAGAGAGAGAVPNGEVKVGENADVKMAPIDLEEGEIDEPDDRKGKRKRRRSRSASSSASRSRSRSASKSASRSSSRSRSPKKKHHKSRGDRHGRGRKRSRDRDGHSKRKKHHRRDSRDKKRKGSSPEKASAGNEGK